MDNIGSRAGLAALIIVLGGCGGGDGASAVPTGSTTPAAGGTSASSSTAITIQPLTQVDVGAGTGYFPDPLPIHLAQGIGASGTLTFAGSNQTLLSCTEPVQAGACQISPISVNVAAFRAQANAAGNTLPSVGNNNIYQDSQGNWQMATTLHLSNGTDNWNVIAHASPTGGGAPVPTSWVADAILVGSLTQPAKANYDGKYFEDGGNLYLLYSRALETSPALHDGVVAQLMVSATQLASTPPVTLIEPDDSSDNGGYNSEYFFIDMSSPFKLVETGNVTQINGKYAVAYSTGDFQEPNYKTGIAWSDTFLPAAGSTYQKILMEDTAGVWGQANHEEVLYFLQAQIADWPNYVANQVLAPGVPSIVQDPNSGAWYLFFAAYDPTDAPMVNASDYDPSHRRPYFVSLQVAVPANVPVAGTASSVLATWITPAPQ